MPSSSHWALVVDGRTARIRNRAEKIVRILPSASLEWVSDDKWPTGARPTNTFSATRSLCWTTGPGNESNRAGQRSAEPSARSDAA